LRGVNRGLEAGEDGPVEHTLASGDVYAAKQALPRRKSAATPKSAIGLFLGLLLCLAAWPAAAQAIKGTVAVSLDNGFARLVFTFANDLVTPQVKTANNIIVISFDRPVDANVDRLATSAADYIGAARRDPDGKAIRIALTRKVTVNSMAAGERLFVDLLPDTWVGLPPGLPREVIDELARRAREAEKQRQERGGDRARKTPIIRVRFANQPTFTRYTFDLPEPIGVTADNRKDKLILTFNGAVGFDLADANAALPASIQSIQSELDRDAAVVRFTFNGKVDVRTFREDNSYVVDIQTAEPKNGRDQPAKPSDALSALAADVTTRKTPPSDVAPPQSKPAADESRRPSTPAAAPREGPALSPEASAPAPMPPTARAPAPSAAAPPTPGGEQCAGEACASPVAPAAAARFRASRWRAPDAPPQAAPPPASAAEAKIAQAAGAAPAGPDGDASVHAVAEADGDNLALRFPFTRDTPAAVFRRGDTVWLVFDTDSEINIAELRKDPAHAIKAATLSRQRGAAIVRLKLERPQLTGVEADGTAWVINLGSHVAQSTKPLSIVRSAAAAGRPSLAIMLDESRELHRLKDPEIGDTLMVVTALAPARGLLGAQEFVEFRLLAASHGVVVEPLADDLKVELAPDAVTLSRPSGLLLSTTGLGSGQSAADDRGGMLDAQLWSFERKEDFGARESQLIFAAAKALETRRLAARVELARFYLAWQMSAEAKGVLDVALKDNPPNAAEPMPLVLRAVANILLDRPQEALKDLANPVVGNLYAAQLWRAMAYAQLGRWNDAHEGFQDLDSTIPGLPVELQQAVMQEMIRANIEVGDITGAVDGMHQFEVLGVPRELEPELAVLGGEVAERLGRVGDALQSYRAAADSWDRRASAQGELREINLQHSLGKLKRAEAIDSLETLTTIWRGDETEVEALKLLSHLYTEEGRYRDSFHVMRTALTAHPSSTMTRAIQDEAAQTFESLFLAGRGDALSAIDALALFYDFRDLTPIGRRGDEMIRRLADRLVTVDLLDQAAELLQYQVDKRLEGAARAQVATRLALIYLMNRKPDMAFATLQATRTEDLNNEMRQQRLLIEARALSEMGRHDVALEIIANLNGREAAKLRGDILWAAHRWREAAEQIEFLYGDRWQQFAPFNDLEQADVLRAAAGYALGEDTLGLARFRERYAGKMGEGPNRRAFDVITEPLAATGADFRDAAHAIAAVDTLGSFLRDLRRRFPDAAPPPPAAAAPGNAPATTGTTPPQGALNRTAAR
jgi:tetratricopeptide (TPR) repeat protein